MAQDIVPALLEPSLPSQWLWSRAGRQVPTALPCCAGPTHSPAFPVGCLMPRAGSAPAAQLLAGVEHALADRPCPDGSPGELSPSPVSDPVGPTSPCRAWIMGMFIKNIWIIIKKKILVGFFLTETFPRQPFLPSQRSHYKTFVLCDNMY